MDAKRPKSEEEAEEEIGQHHSRWQLIMVGGAGAGARAGTFGESFATPAIIIPAVGGLAPHLTKDIWEQEGKYSNAFLSIPYDQCQVFTAAQRGLHASLNLRPTQVSLVVKLPSAAAAPTNNNNNSRNRQESSSTSVSQVHAALRPNLAVSPADRVNAYAGSNRTTLAVERTTAAFPATGGGSGGSTLLSVVGKDERSIAACVEKALAGVGGGGGVYVDVASPALAMGVCGKLSSAAAAGGVRAVQGHSATPRQVLEYIAAGYDLVETNYPQLLAKMGHASTYAIALDEPIAGFTSSGLEEEEEDSHDMRDSSLLVDQKSILPQCACFTCQHHTRAYVRHLLETREMLGETLLYAHNLFRLMELVRVARVHIAKGSFAEWFEAWGK